MKVQDIMHMSLRISRYDAALTAVARLMYEGECGTLPGVNIDLRVLQVAGNRDIRIVPSLHLGEPATILVGEVILGKFYACSPEHDVQSVLGIMRDMQLQRLPVVNRHGGLQGILSISDLAPAAGQAINAEEFADVPANRLEPAYAACEVRPRRGLAKVALV